MTMVEVNVGVGTKVTVRSGGGEDNDIARVDDDKAGRRRRRRVRSGCWPLEVRKVRTTRGELGYSDVGVMGATTTSRICRGDNTVGMDNGCRGQW
jgi:hypothetical protein